MKSPTSKSASIQPVISVIMPCHNRSFDLLRVLQAYDHQDTDDWFEVIAIDDGSTDQTYQLLLNYHPHCYDLIAEHFTRNQGPAAARNRGIQLARAPLIIFVGDDIYPGESFVSGHITAHKKLPEKTYAILGHTIWARNIPQNTLMTHIDGVGAQQFSYHYLKDGDEYDYRQVLPQTLASVQGVDIGIIR